MYAGQIVERGPAEEVTQQPGASLHAAARRLRAGSRTTSAARFASRAATGPAPRTPPRRQDPRRAEPDARPRRLPVQSQVPVRRRPLPAGGPGPAAGLRHAGRGLLAPGPRRARTRLRATREVDPRRRTSPPRTTLERKTRLMRRLHSYRRLLAVAAAGLLAAGLAACSTNSSSSSSSSRARARPRARPWSWRARRRPPSPRPSTRTSPPSAAYGMGATGLIYEPLIQFDLAAPPKYYPWLATSYAWSNGGKTITFTIRQGVKWNNGTPFTPADVAFTYNLIKRNTAINLGGLTISSVSTPATPSRSRSRRPSTPTWRRSRAPGSCRRRSGAGGQPGDLHGREPGRHRALHAGQLHRRRASR